MIKSYPPSLQQQTRPRFRVRRFEDPWLSPRAESDNDDGADVKCVSVSQENHGSLPGVLIVLEEVHSPQRAHQRERLHNVSSRETCPGSTIL